jgi:PAS domain S-box-containing protein
VVDWRQLQRWGISERRLPPGTAVLNKEPTLWERYRRYVVGVLSLLVLQTLLILALLIQRERRRRSENALQQAEERFARAFRSSPEAMTITTLAEGRFIEANDAYLSMLGYERSEVIGRTAADLQLWVHPEQRALLIARLLKHEVVRDEEISVRTKQGKVRQVRRSIEMIQIQGQQCLLVLSRDVTEQKLLEQRLRQAQKMEAVGMLAGGIAHDFNNLLSVILGYSELLRADLSSDSPVYHRIDAIEKAGRSAAALTAQLLAFSRVQMLQLRVLNLNASIVETQKMLRRLIGEDIELEVTLDPALGQVKADSGLLLQVLMNLAANARDAMPRGGKLTIQTATIVFHEGACEQDVAIVPGRYVSLTVTDSGEGMDEETREHLFNPFFTTKPVGKGTGLGMATVYSIVKQCGGFIFAESERGVGTVVKIYLPQVDQAVEVVPAGKVLTHPRGSETILLVEDDLTLREMLREHLKNAGYSVLSASNGGEAIQLVERYPDIIDLLVTDVIMPHTNGPDLAKFMTSQRPEMKVLYISGYVGDKLKDISKLAPGVALLQKPFQLADFSDKVREVLSFSGNPASKA